MAQQRVRFESLDAIRGLGALAVILWHWQHLTLLTGPKYTYPPLAGPFRSTEPFYGLFSPFYEFGFRAVDLFFVISGFVFYLLYQQSIAEKRTPARDFFILRFSRLYPLHFLTLLFVAVVEFFFLQRTHQTFVYYNYDWPHFIGNLFLINAPVYSFNGPTWALTVEGLLYLIFWPLARTGWLKHWPLTLVLLGVGLWLFQWPPHGHIGTLNLDDLGFGVWGRGLAGFFAGGPACSVFTWAREKRGALSVFAVLTVLGWIVTFALCYLRPNLGAGLSADVNFWIFNVAQFWGLFYVLFPATIIALALWDGARGTSIPGFKWLGSISYSAYVLHFPLQLTIALAAVYGLLPATFGTNPLCFLGFFAMLAVLSHFGFLWLEEPIQHWFRKTFVPGPATKPASATA